MPKPKTLPTHLRARALKALATLHAWNGAVQTARNLAALTGHATEALNEIELLLRGHGWSLQDIYGALGQPRPQVEDWFEAQR